jgi:hypothetical protein
MTDQEANLVFQEPELKVIQEVILQIEKDFGMAGFEFSNAPYLKLESLIPELEYIIAKLQQENHSKWMKIVYRVDLTEKQYKFVQNLGGSTPLNMAKAVILREFQKVKNRLIYS